MTFVDRFFAADDTNLDGRTPTGTSASYNVESGSWSIQGGAAEAGATDSLFYIDPGITDLRLSVIVKPASATYSQLRLRWDEVANTGWFLQIDTCTLYYWNGSTSTSHGTLNWTLPGNGDQWCIEADLSDPDEITIRIFNLQFVEWGLGEFTVTSSLNNDKTSIGFSASASGLQLDCLRFQTEAYDYPLQWLHLARIQRGILQNHVPFIISSYDTGTPSRGDCWGDNSTYGNYYDGWWGLLQLYDIWETSDRDLFLEAAWKQFQITHDDYYEPGSYGVPGFRPYSYGAYQLWERLANADAYETARRFPTTASFGPSGDVSPANFSDPDAITGYHRECALALQTHVVAYIIGGVSATEVNTTRWGVLRDWCYDWVDYWCDEVSPGEYAWTGVARQVAGFMAGLMARSLWLDYTVSADSRFQAALLKLCNWVWDEFWNPAASPPGLLYDCNPDSPAYDSDEINNDLNMLITAAFAKCAQLTGDSVHMDRADTLFTYSVLDADFASGGKQKNQQTMWLNDYINWRAAFSPVRRSGRLFRRFSA